MKNNKTKQKALRYNGMLATDFLVGIKCLARNTLGRKGYFGSRFEETESIIAGKAQRQVFPWPREQLFTSQPAGAEKPGLEAGNGSKVQIPPPPTPLGDLLPLTRPHLLKAAHPPKLQLGTKSPNAEACSLHPYCNR